MMKRSLAVLFLALAIVAAACSDSDPQADSDALGAGTDTPVVAGLCPEDEPDCDVDTDIVVPPGDVVTPDGGDAVTGFVVDGGLTVPEAIATDATGTLAVRGFLFGDDQGFRLCEVLAESFPPQCGGVSLPLGNFDSASTANDENVHEDQGITWSDDYMLFFGEVADGSLILDPLVSG